MKFKSWRQENKYKMSLSQTLLNEIEKVLDSHWDCLVDKYGLNKDELRKLWNGKNVEVKKASKDILSSR